MAEFDSVMLEKNTFEAVETVPRVVIADWLNWMNKNLVAAAAVEVIVFVVVVVEVEVAVKEEKEEEEVEVVAVEMVLLHSRHTSVNLRYS